MDERKLWDRYKQYLCDADSIGLRLDISQMMFDDTFFERLSEPMARALLAMEELERGSLANMDEKRMVGHYWLRAPDLAPDETIRADIRAAIERVNRFADDIHAGTTVPTRADGFYVVLVIGIGGSALGAQFVSDALGDGDDAMMLRFIDNTDPDGIDRTLAELEDVLDQTLTVVVTKSGSTKETRNGMLEVAEAYRRNGLDFAKHAVAVTCEGSTLARQATDEGWLGVFPMWDFIGGRTSVLSTAGLLPAALQGIDIDALLTGARDCDMVTRQRDLMKNPAALLAMMWHYAGDGRGAREMVILPYRDRLGLFGKYLQQLVMESIGKELDRDGRVVHQGLTVYGNKGTTDQHAYVQQLREGLDNFFVTFVEARRDRDGQSIQVEDGVTSGDYLHACWQGTRRALAENSRESITITVDRIDAYRIGVLIALFERTVGLYAELVNVNAYHQPGVEAGKKAADSALDLQRKAIAHLGSHPDSVPTADELAETIGEPTHAETLFHLLEHAAANRDHGVVRTGGARPWDAKFSVSSKR